MTMEYCEPVQLEDRVLYLYMLGLLKQKGQVINQIQEQKLYFLIQYNAMKENGILSKIRFQRNKYGPVAPHVYDLERDFKEQALIHVQHEQYFRLPQTQCVLSESGLRIFDELQDLFNEEEGYLHIVAETIDNLGTERGWDLRNIIYKIVIEGRAIQDYKMKEIIPTTPENPDWIWVVPKDWISTIELLFSPGSIAMLDEMIVNTRKGPITRWTGA